MYVIHNKALSSAPLWSGKENLWPQHTLSFYNIKHVIAIQTIIDNPIEISFHVSAACLLPITEFNEVNVWESSQSRFKNLRSYGLRSISPEIVEIQCGNEYMTFHFHHRYT